MCLRRHSFDLAKALGQHQVRLAERVGFDQRQHHRLHLAVARAGLG
jgi:hypothetical protein